MCISVSNGHSCPLVSSYTNGAYRFANTFPQHLHKLCVVFVVLFLFFSGSLFVYFVRKSVPRCPSVCRLVQQLLVVSGWRWHSSPLLQETARSPETSTAAVQGNCSSLSLLTLTFLRNQHLQGEEKQTPISVCCPSSLRGLFQIHVGPLRYNLTKDFHKVIQH